MGNLQVQIDGQTDESVIITDKPKLDTPRHDKLLNFFEISKLRLQFGCMCESKVSMRVCVCESSVCVCACV